ISSGDASPSVVILQLNQAEDGNALVRFQRQFTVGRDDSCDVVINNGLVSRHHLRFIPKGADWIIQDLDSTNGTFVNGKKITALKIGDRGTATLGSRGPEVSWRLQLQERFGGEATFEEPQGLGYDPDNTRFQDDPTQISDPDFRAPNTGAGSSRAWLWLAGLVLVVLMGAAFWYFTG
nr:FHA domain-containing protein [Calditrichia bacterium]